jgi:hypothetical protein
LYALFGQDDEVTEDEVWECSTYDENKYIGWCNFSGKFEGSRELDRPGRRWNDNIKMVHNE